MTDSILFSLEPMGGLDLASQGLDLLPQALELDPQGLDIITPSLKPELSCSWGEWSWAGSEASELSTLSTSPGADSCLTSSSLEDDSFECPSPLAYLEEFFSSLGDRADHDVDTDHALIDSTMSMCDRLLNGSSSSCSSTPTPPPAASSPVAPPAVTQPDMVVLGINLCNLTCTPGPQPQPPATVAAAVARPSGTTALPPHDYTSHLVRLAPAAPHEAADSWSPPPPTVVRRRGPRTQVRPEDKVFGCQHPGCGKLYAKSSHLKAHMRRHTGEKPFACGWAGCEWKFSRSDELARHRRSHYGIKPYSCPVCQKAFTRSDHLAKHTKVHRRGRHLHRVRPALHVVRKV